MLLPSVNEREKNRLGQANRADDRTTNYPRKFASFRARGTRSARYLYLVAATGWAKEPGKN